MNAKVCALTGANGYVGSAIRRALQASGWGVLPLTRNAGPDGIRWTLESATAIAPELRARGITALVHAAWDMKCVSPKDYARINLDGSRRLFGEAVAAGIGHCVFISTISAFEGAVSVYGRTKLETENAAAQAGALSVRPGLVWGDTPGGVFGAIQKSVRDGTLVPLIGTGEYPQYLIHEDDLGAAIERAISENWREQGSAPVTLANPRMWRFRDLVLACAEQAGRRIRLVSLPWRLIYAGLKTAESAGVRLAFRSDSVLSLVNQNPAPDFSAIDRFAIRLRPWPGEAAASRITAD